ncbi:MAG: heterodisulfide reductase-related iron-sulfur binding cluster [Actinomycetota bacterium]
MTTTYDPDHPAYGDRRDLGLELGRVFELCGECRLCADLCPSFDSLFDLLDQHGGDAQALSKADEDRVVSQCYQCKLCDVRCPYVPPHEWALDFPRLMLRAKAAHRSGRDLQSEAFGRVDLVGRVACAAAPLTNRAIAHAGLRRLMERFLGVSSRRQLLPYASQRFTTWFRRRRRRPVPADVVAVFPTCLVEYQQPEIGRALVGVLEHNNLGCSVPSGLRCCGMPWLDDGNVEAFRRQAGRNVRRLAPHARLGRPIVVAQPTCAYALKREYPRYLKSSDAELVARSTFDAAEYLMTRHSEGPGLDLDFPGIVPAAVSLHQPCHLRALDLGFKTRDLISLTGARVQLVNGCAGIDGTWGLRAENYELACAVAQPLVRMLGRDRAAVTAGSCALANAAIEESTGHRPIHPIEILARAYGLDIPGSALPVGPSARGTT